MTHDTSLRGELALRIITGTYWVTQDDFLVCGDARDDDVVVRLPAPQLGYDETAGIGRSFVVQKLAGAHRVLLPDVDRQVGCVIDRCGTGVVVTSNGAGWWAIART